MNNPTEELASVCGANTTDFNNILLSVEIFTLDSIADDVQNVDIIGAVNNPVLTFNEEEKDDVINNSLLSN